MQPRKRPGLDQRHCRSHLPAHPQLGNDVPTVLKHPLTKGDLLSVLPGRDRVRLLAMLVAGEGPHTGQGCFRGRKGVGRIWQSGSQAYACPFW